MTPDKSTAVPAAGAHENGAAQGHTAHSAHAKTGLWALTLGSIGVVYGDIGTSPIYALRESLAHTKDSGIAESDVLGVVSILIWALTLIVTLKYVIFLMRADNKGEGGTLSLMALSQKAIGRRATPLFALGMAGAALFCGDAIITPAVSVLSAVEGLKHVSMAFEPYVLPITLVILVLLFGVQSRGTGSVAALFGPVMLVWFVTLAVLGVSHIGDAPSVLYAFNPVYGVTFLLKFGWLGFAVLGSVFLAVTGAEALYGDMGHFGRVPIRLAWGAVVFPALVLNYLGQGAMILRNPAAAEDPFFLSAPEWALAPLVILSTLAAVIASQATITGAFSLTRQAIQLGLLPRFEIQHTSDALEGQIFIPRINRLMLLGVLILVLAFKSSSNLTSAYGISVSGSMAVDSALALVVVWRLWKWPLWVAILGVGAFLCIDLAFFTANLLKFRDGGYVPIILSSCMVLLMWTWVRGSRILVSKTHRDSIPTRELIRMLEKSKPTRVPGTAIFLTSDPEVAPSALMHNLKHNKVLHERVLLMSVKTEDTPRVSPSHRYELEKISGDFTRVVLHFGYMESPRVPNALAAMRKAGLKYDIMTTSFFLGRRTIKASAHSGMPLWQDHLFIAMSKQAANATDFFSIPSDRVVELGAQVTV
jgi:KUP system potassium uptake protein